MNRPERKSTRWPGFDYRLPGPYHVVICTEGRINRFATMTHDRYSRGVAGDMVATVWLSGPDRFRELGLDAFVVVPNHVPLVFWFEPRVGYQSPTVGDVMKWFKSETTLHYGRGVHQFCWPPYDRRLWQRNYFDHVIRTDREGDAVCAYIENNPRVWTLDSLFQA